MKFKIICGLLVLLLGMPLMAAPPRQKSVQQAAMSVDNGTYLDANRILIFITNHGNFGRDLAGVFGNDYGTYFPYFGDPGKISDGTLRNATPYYAGGLWIGAIDSVTNDTLVTISEYSSEYVPGPMENGTYMADRSAFHVYNLFSDSLYNNPNQDYQDWPVDQGAPTVFDAILGEDVPQMFGDQMCWSVFNDADATEHTNMSTDPLGIEVKFTAFAFDQSGSLGNMVFLKFQIYNKGDKTLNKCFISLWSDPDLGTSTDDYVGVDTATDLAYCYNSTATDSKYATLPNSVPPAVGLDFFQGPLIYTGVNTDSANMWGQKWPEYVNMGMYSFNKYINGTDPDNAIETYYYMLGLDAKSGGIPVIDPTTGDPTTFQLTGDPVTGTGWLDEVAADRRMMQTTGPITFRPGDSTEIVAAFICAQGSTYLNSITQLRSLDDYAQKVYDNGFNPPRPPAKPVLTVARKHQEISISWTDTSEVNQGAYPFEGYTVWQGASSAGPWTELATYDLDNSVFPALVDTLADPYSGLNLPYVYRALKNSGLHHLYTVSTDAVNGGDLKDITEYYFKVSAFSFPTPSGDTTYVDSLGVPVPKGDRFLESETVVAVRPVAPPAGYKEQAANGEELAVTHTAGISQAQITATVVDPLALTGHTYRVTFEENNQAGLDLGNPLGVAWFLLDVTSGDTLFSDMGNISNDEDYFVVDGIYLKVAGPALQGKAYEYASPATPNISPVGLADHPYYTGDRWFTGDSDNGGELLFGGVFMEPNFWGETSLGPLDYPPVEIRWRPMASYTDINGDGAFTIGEPYVVDDPGETQNAFMYTGFSGANYEGFFPVPFTAWDVTDPDNPRQLNVVMRDRDGDHQWELNFENDTTLNMADTLLPRRGDLRYNYTWITTTDYDPTGAYYGDGTAGSVDFWSYDGGDGVWDAAWCMWLYPRDASAGPRPMLGAEGSLTLYPPDLIQGTDVFEFTAPAAKVVANEKALEAIKAVPNPFYMFGPYDPTSGNYQIWFHHLPKRCTITIYNLAGEYINKIEKNDDEATAHWNLQTEKQLPVASGIYIYVVEAPGFGQKIGKMAVFYEAEVLQVY